MCGTYGWHLSGHGQGTIDGLSSGYATKFAVTVDSSVSTPVIEALASQYANPQPAIAGTAEAGTVVRLYMKQGGNEVLLGEAVAVGTPGDTSATPIGAWQITPSVMLPDGTNRIFAKAVDSAGNVSVATADTNLVISAATPDLTMGRLSGDNILTLTDLDSGAYASGYVTPGSAVTVSIAGRDMLATVQASGRWFYQLTEDDYDAVGVADNVTITATATGANGTTTSTEQVVNFRTEKTAIPANPELDGGLVKTSAGQAGSVFGKAQINANARSTGATSTCVRM